MLRVAREKVVFLERKSNLSEREWDVLQGGKYLGMLTEHWNDAEHFTLAEVSHYSVDPGLAELVGRQRFDMTERQVMKFIRKALGG